MRHGGKEEMEQTRQNALLESVTLMLLVANVLVFIIVGLGGDQALLLLAQTGELFFAGEYWQPLTAMFVHFGWLHLIFNMYGLFYFGRLNEIGYTRAQYLAIYFGAGLIGNAASLFLIPLDTPTGGASGAIFGLIGGYVAMERRGVNMAAAVVYAALIFLLSAGPGVNIFAHLFGAAAGFAAGALFRALGKKDEGF